MKSHNAICSIMALIFSMIFTSCNQQQKPKYDKNFLAGEHPATHTDASTVPVSDRYDASEKVIVKLEVIEKVMRLADGVKYNLGTFGGILRPLYTNISVLLLRFVYHGPQIKKTRYEAFCINISNSKGEKLLGNQEV